MHNISKNLGSLFFRGNKLTNVVVATTVASIMLIVYVFAKNISHIKKYLLKAFSPTQTSNLSDNRSKWASDFSWSAVSSGGKDKFPDEDNRYKDIITFLVSDGEYLADDQGKKVEIKSLKMGDLTAILDAFSFKVEDQAFQALLSHNSGISKDILINEIRGCVATQLHIEKESLQNIKIVPKILYSRIKKCLSKSILVRKSPDMEADKAARDKGLIKDRKKCKTAAESLAKLAGEFIFSVPNNNLRESALYKGFRNMRCDFDWSSLDVGSYGFFPEELLGKDYFTISEDSKGNAEVNIMSSSKLPAFFPKKPSLEEIKEAFIFNYSIVVSIFPENVKDILKVIEKDRELTEDDKNFLMSVSRSTIAKLSKSPRVNKYHV
ncbi:MAG: hypothetical protein KAH32_06495 [Chlamydiia bacterium]|nr:hypothetical protein [Chlamydiia bacterium]